jgi:hypothetical protein
LLRFGDPPNLVTRDNGVVRWVNVGDRLDVPICLHKKCVKEWESESRIAFSRRLCELSDKSN